MLITLFSFFISTVLTYTLYSIFIAYIFGLLAWKVPRIICKNICNFKRISWRYFVFFVKYDIQFVPFMGIRHTLNYRHSEYGIKTLKLGIRTKTNFKSGIQKHEIQIQSLGSKSCAWNPVKLRGFPYMVHYKISIILM